VERRRFLTLVTGAASALTGVLLGVPLVGRLLAPLASSGAGPSAWRAVGALTDFPQGRPQRVSFPVQVQDGWVSKTTQQAAWVVRTGEDALRVLSTVCPHLGCSVKLAAAEKGFACPCHDSSFGEDGSYEHGPARRGLDELPVRVVGGVVELRWVEFEPGIAERKAIGGDTA
jgi:Rieske Fe-S protein